MLLDQKRAYTEQESLETTTFSDSAINKAFYTVLVNTEAENPAPLLSKKKKGEKGGKKNTKQIKQKGKLHKEHGWSNLVLESVLSIQIYLNKATQI